MSRQDLELEQLLLGELPAGRAAALRQSLLADPALAARYQALSASNAETLARHPTAEVVAEIERRAGRTKGRTTRLWLAAPALAAAALAIAIAIPRPLGPTEDETRIKGLLPALHVFRDRAGAIEELAPGASARPGDRIQLRYTSAGAPWGVLLSIDGRGGVTVHFPLEPNAAPRLEPGSTTLPRALALDDAPLFERFIFVTCNRRPDVQRVVSAAKVLAQQASARVAPLGLEPGCSNQTSFVLSKER